MYRITRKPYGYHILLEGMVTNDELTKWVEESKRALATPPKDFGVFVDMRDLKPMLPDAQAVMQEGQKLYKAAGMVRSVVILESALVASQFKRIAKGTGIDAWERYIAAEKTPDWEKQSQEWLTKGTEPTV